MNFLRLAGLKESFGAEPHRRETDERFLLASQYIDDNVRQNVSVAELASYCCISEKQLQRIFEREAGVSVKEYISKKRAIEIEKLLLDPALSLRDVSEKMNFNNEYYFNAFFKKYAGMSPGAYRKSFKK